jgi:hypothetical protein
MSRVSISRSYAVLVGLETYKKTTSKIKAAEKAAKHTKDKLLHPERVRQEKERQYLEALKAEQEKARKSEKFTSTGISKMIGRFTDKEDAKGDALAGRRRVPEGPEDGVPPPEGHR